MAKRIRYFTGNQILEQEFELLNDKGYIYLRKHTGKPGFYFNGDHAACPITDDYSGMAAGRTMDKASRLVREVYVNELLDEIEIDAATGKMSP